MERKLKIEVGESISALRYFLKKFEVSTKLYKMFFRGKSFDFEGFRDYSSDEDVSSIDWKASSRAGKLISRKYKEEDDKKVLFVLDMGENMMFGSYDKLKCEYAAEIVISLSDLVINNNDRAGLLLFNDRVQQYLLPKRGKQTFESFYNILSNPDSYGGGSNLNEALDYIIKNSDPHISAVVLISDFINVDKKTRNNLNIIANKYETIALMIKDPIDKSLPNINGEFIVENPFNGQQLLIEPRLANRQYENNSLKQEKFVQELFKSSGVDAIELITSKSFIYDLINFLKERLKKREVRR